MAEINLEFIAERLQRVQVEQTQLRDQIADFRDAIAGFRDEMAVQTGILTRIANAQDRAARRMDRLQDGVDLTNKYLTDIVTRFELRLAKLEA